MSLEFGSGAFFLIGDDGQHMPLGDCFSGTLEYEPYDEVVEPVLSTLNKDYSFTYELNAIDLELLSQSCHFDPSQNFTVEYNMPIMIQARWHKKAKVRKKWLHRYGMRPDKVCVKTDNAYLSEHEGCIEFETESLLYIWKPHQQRNGLKMEM